MNDIYIERCNLHRREFPVTEGCPECQREKVKVFKARLKVLNYGTARVVGEPKPVGEAEETANA